MFSILIAQLHRDIFRYVYTEFKFPFIFIESLYTGKHLKVRLKSHFLAKKVKHWKVHFNIICNEAELSFGNYYLIFGNSENIITQF